MKSNSISIQHPELLPEWDYELNTVSPDDITCGVTTHVHWICKDCGHRWSASVYKRCKQHQGCPRCAAKARGKAKTASCAKKNSLEARFPDIAREWHPTKNGELKPYEVSAFCNKKVYWLCPDCGCEYQATVNHRTNGGTGCPKCADRKNGKQYSLNAAKKNNFAEQFPQLAAEWDYEGNGDLKPEDVSVSSSYLVKWICSFCSHHWTNSINKRTAGHGCPKCTKAGTSFSEQAIFFYTRQLYPDAVHRYIVDNIEFDIYIESIKTAVEYDGVFYHNSAVANEKENRKDDYCAEYGIHMIRIRDPKLQDTKNAYRITCVDEQQDHLKNAIIALLDHLSPGHSIQVDITNDMPFIITEYRNEIRANSIAVNYPELLEIWHPTKNLPLTPDRVTIGMHIKIWWHCPVCDQDYLQDINHKIHGEGCPICAGKTIIAGANDLATTHPILAAQWHKEKNGDLTPSDITAGSSKPVWWHCNVCGHDWQAAPATRKRGVGCSICGRKAATEKLRKRKANTTV